jgi:mannose-6-phosphate isomerase-like protein (cupin superfamily)
VIVVAPTAQDRQRLAELAVAPASIADDGLDYTGVVVDKPWGHEMQVRRAADFAMTRLEITGGAETSMHCHPNKTVVLVVQRGDVRLNALTGEFALKQGESVLVEKGAFHRLTALPGGAAVIEIEWPPNKRDLVRLEDRYGRAGQGYEKCA